MSTERGITFRDSFGNDQQGHGLLPGVAGHDVVNVDQLNAAQPIVCDGIAVGTRKLNAEPIAGYNAAKLAWVVTVGDWFRFDPASTLTADGITVVTAAGGAGRWIRLLVPNPAWQARTAWVVDTAAGGSSDENDGLTSGTAIKTLGEVARRMREARITTSTVVDILSDLDALDQPVFQGVRCVRNSTSIVRLYFRGNVGTPLATGAFSAVRAALSVDLPTTNDYRVTNNAGISWNVSSGVVYKRTSGAQVWWWAAKDLGSNILRTSIPLTMTDTITDLGRTEVTLQPGDTWAAYALPKINQVFGLDGVPVLYQLLDVRCPATILRDNQQNVQWKLCSFGTAAFIQNGDQAYGCCFRGTLPFATGNLNGGATIQGGLVIGDGTTTVAQFTGGAMDTADQAIVFQGCGVNIGHFASASGFSAYFFDYVNPGGYLIEVMHNAHLKTAGIGGSGNSATPLRVRAACTAIVALAQFFPASGFCASTSISLDNLVITTADLPMNQLDKGNFILLS